MRSYVQSPVFQHIRALSGALFGVGERLRRARPKASELASAALLAGSLVALTACNGAATLEATARPKAANQWYERAQLHFKAADVEEAHDSVAKALTMVPSDVEVRMLAARIALARLEFAEALRFLKGVKSTEAAGLRGRALWYKGDLEAAADELEAMLNDPEVKDDWAKGIAKLARRGQGRTPFALSGGLLAAVEMPHVNPVVPFFVVPLEIDGDSALAMISTGKGELVLRQTDSGIAGTLKVGKTTWTVTGERSA